MLPGLTVLAFHCQPPSHGVVVCKLKLQKVDSIILCSFCHFEDGLLCFVFLYTYNWQRIWKHFVSYVKSKDTIDAKTKRNSAVSKDGSTIVIWDNECKVVPPYCKPLVGEYNKAYKKMGK